MLIELSIKNIALIERLTISFSDGLHVLTGETGAGKSIVVDSVNLVLGSRADKSLVRSGEERATVEGFFDISNNEAANAVLGELSLESEDGVVCVARELTASGRSVCRIQGSVVPLTSLKKFTACLVNVHGQHEHQALMDPARHIDFLDSFGGEALAEKKRIVEERYRVLSETRTRLNRLETDASERERRRDMLAFQLGEIKAGKLKKGEEEELNRKALLLENAEKIENGTEQAYSLIYQGSGRSASAQDSLKRASSAMKDIASYDERFEKLAGRIEGLYYEAQDIGYELGSIIEEMNYDPNETERVYDRLEVIKKLTRKYGPNVEDVIAFGKKCEEELSLIDGGEEMLQTLKDRLKTQEKAYLEAAKVLSDARKETSKTLIGRILEELAELGMGKTRMEARFEALKQAAPEGLDAVEFMISPNPGEPLKPMAQIASGGELSRIMLAIKAVTADKDSVDTMIFDEIDTGVSGRMAQVVGEKMAKIGFKRQVICVTHLAQIASLADVHYRVEKSVKDGRTGSTVIRMDDAQRVHEVARLVSGADSEDDSAMEHAAHLIRQAEKRKTELHA